MVGADAHGDLLFGLLALQNGLIDQGQLVAAFQAWSLDKSRSLAEHLAARGDLSKAQCDAIATLATLHLEKHGSDPEKSIAALELGRSTRDSLESLGDPAVEASLAHAGCPSESTQIGDMDQTVSYAFGTATSHGQRFRVLRPHARGGLGAVFVALDAELNREVALKQILDHHVDDHTSRTRFLNEAEITGGLEHPGIVPVYGLGTDAGGRPYYAMRFVKGDSLKTVIEQFHGDDPHPNPLLVGEGGPRPGERPSRDLRLRRLLRRFIDVCNAIDYAHSRGVLHRDIKPSNIIVGKHGETLMVDWGLAKSMGHTEPGTGTDERTLIPSSASGSAQTLPGSALGTPAYMSPEQARGDLDLLGPRSDVYSLGATLYCILTGKPPFKGDDVGAVLRAVQAHDFPAPRRLAPSLDKALEAICNKAMAHQPDERYATPRGLADDIERWMADEPVTAWREPFTRKLLRWLTRHRTTVTAAGVAALVALVGLAAVLSVQTRANELLRIKNEALAVAQRETADERDQKATEAAKARTEEQKARQAAAESRAVLDFFQENVLAAARPKDQEGGLGPGVTIRQAVDQAELKIAQAFHDKPVVEASIRGVLGGTYFYLNEAKLAIAQFERTLELRRRVLGSDHPDTLAAVDDLGMAYQQAGRLGDALSLLEENLKRRRALPGPVELNTLVAINNLANGYRSAGRIDTALPLFVESLKGFEAMLGPDHPYTIGSMNNLAQTNRDADRLNDAIPLLEESLKRGRAKLGLDHPYTLGAMNNLSLAYRDASRYAEAAHLSEESLKRSVAALGADNPDTFWSMGALAGAYAGMGRLADAIKLFEKALAGLKTKIGADQPDTLLAMSNLAGAYDAAGRPADAVPLYEAALQGLKAKLGPDHAKTLTAMNNLATAYLHAGKPAAAEPVLRETLKLREPKTPDDWRTFEARAQLGACLLDQKQYVAAESLLLGGYKGMEARQARIAAPYKNRLAETGALVIQLYDAWGKNDKANEWREKLAGKSGP